MNFTKIIIMSLVIITLFIIPVIAEPIYSNYSHYAFGADLTSTGSRIYISYNTPTYLNLNFSMYDSVDEINMISLGVRSDVSSALNSTSFFNFTYSGYSVATGYVHIFMDGSNYLHEDYYIESWNTSFTSSASGKLAMYISYNTPTIFNSIPYIVIVDPNRYYDGIYTYSTNPDFYIGSTTAIRRNDGYLYKQHGNQMVLFNIVGESAESTIIFEDTPYTEYDNAIVNFSVEKIMTNYPDKRIFLEIAVPKAIEPYYSYKAYELEDFTGYRGVEIFEKSPTVRTYDNATAYIRAYEQDLSSYETLLEIEEPVLDWNHTLLNYTGYDYPINQSYITGQYISVNVDIMDYIETDYLGYPDEYFQLWIYAYSNSNQGNRYDSFTIDSKYWNADPKHIHTFQYAPYSIIDSVFNATIESYITVYRLGNTTQLTPTIYTNMWSSDYIPEGEEGYIPPNIPEEPDELDIPDPIPDPDLPDTPEFPDEPPVYNGSNQSINVSWVEGYYSKVNGSVNGLCSPIYNFTYWSLSPIYSLNSSVSDFNGYMNTSFTQTTKDSSILYESINTIFNAIPPKVRNVITYYLIWIVLLIILKKD